MDRIVEYAILRFVPATYRGEQINVGVVVFDKERLDVRIHIQPSLIKALGTDPSKLEWISSYLRETDDPKLPIEERWSRLCRFPGFALSDRGFLCAETDEQYEFRIDRIRSDYVDRPRPTATRRRSTSLFRQLHTVFREYNVMGRHAEDVSRHKVVSNVPVGPAGKLHVDFLVKNGQYHATETADFRTSSDAGTAELKDAALASVTLQYARDQLGKHTHCYFVYAASPLTESSISPALQLADRAADDVFNIESGEDRRRYFDLILAAAGSPSLFTSN